MSFNISKLLVGRAILGVNFPCGKINTRRNFTPDSLYKPGLLVTPKLQNSPHSQSVEAEDFIQKLASRCARLPKEARTTGMPRYAGHRPLKRKI